MNIFNEPLVSGILVKRYKRFLADVKLLDGTIVTAHCTNSGSMKSCIEEGAEVCLSKALSATRKTPYTWEMIKINEVWVGVNTMNANVLAYEWMLQGQIPGLEGYEEVKREVKYQDSRFDIFANGAQGPCFVEVKNVSLKEGQMAMFPDAVTARGLKHLETLVRVKREGIRAVMLYMIQRTDVECFAPAAHIDAAYAKALKFAFVEGVEVIPLKIQVSPLGFEIRELMKNCWG